MQVKINCLIVVMALCVLQINIQNWKKNNYFLQCELTNSNPDVILINETGEVPNNNLKLYGYRSITKSLGAFSGVAILIKYDIKYSEIPTADQNTLSIRILTTIGPIIICTSYIPPRLPTLPILQYNKILSYNLPTIFISDINAHHPFLHNTRGQGNTKGDLLFSFAQNKQCKFLGPPFNIYITRPRQGKPDVILVNKHFDIFHTNITSGNNVGSDHIPIIRKISTTPIRTLKPPTLDFNTLNIQEYKNQLSSLELPLLDNKPTQTIDDNIETIITNIQMATNNNCTTRTSKLIQTYTPTNRMKQKVRQLQAATNHYYIYGNPSLERLHVLKEEIIDIIKEEGNNNWELLVEEATECLGNPAKFWNRVHNLMEGSKSPQVPLKNITINDDSEESDFGEEVVEYIFDPKEQANTFSNKWSKVFTTNNNPNFNRNNKRFIDNWYNIIKNELKEDNVIDHSKLDPNHPLTKSIETQGLKYSLSKLKNSKAPGITKIKAIQLKNLPENIINALKDIYDSMVASKYFPSILLKIRMVFHNKPNSDASDPLNYRPISLIKTLCKVFERIINNRLIMYCEHHNLFNEFQFGFRHSRSTQQVITIFTSAIEESTRQQKTSIVATRDIKKAFDTVWHRGLLYKLYNITHNNILFTGHIRYYLINRTVTPIFNNEAGTPFIPEAGVPQGSVIGPTLFNIFVNDIPSHKYIDTIRLQFADDIVTVTRSFGRGKNKVKQATTKLKNELKIIEDWEKDWRILVNPNKCKIATKIQHLEEFDLINDIQIDNTPVQTTNTVKILGYKFNFAKNINNTHCKHNAKS